MLVRFMLILGPPIHGECGASYRYTENSAIDTGMKPFVVEIKILNNGGKVISLGLVRLG